MDLIDSLQNLALKIQKQRDMIQTEEATKNAFIMPFIAALGYDVFDPTEVVPEFTADVGIKKGEKIDYAIMQGAEPLMFFECKKVGSSLNPDHASQLLRYFQTTPKLRIGVLTNGISYHFYSDLEQPHMMDKTPFLALDLLNLQEPLVHELKKMTKTAFNIEAVLSAASELKYMRSIKTVIAEQMTAPSDDIVKAFLRAIGATAKNPKALQNFSDMFRRSLTQFINEQINERLKSAMTGNVVISEAKAAPSETKAEAAQPQIVTTPEEFEGFVIIKSIVRDVIPPERVFIRDQQTFCGVLVDNSIRQVICRMWFNNSAKKFITIGEAQKAENKIPINVPNDIYAYADQLREAARAFIKEQPPANGQKE